MLTQRRLWTAGNLYGTSPYGVAENGVVYKIDAEVQRSPCFPDIADGAEPYGGLGH